jgi:hypothetical protein
MKIMKSKLECVPHALISEDNAVEIWYGGEMVATVYGADGPGVRVISKHQMHIVRGGPEARLHSVKVIEVRIEPS